MFYLAYYRNFVEAEYCPKRFIHMAQALGKQMPTPLGISSLL